MKLQEGEYTIGESVTPKKYKKLVMNSDGTLKSNLQFLVEKYLLQKSGKESWTGLRSSELYGVTPMRNMGR